MKGDKSLRYPCAAPPELGGASVGKLQLVDDRILAFFGMDMQFHATIVFSRNSTLVFLGKE